MPLEDALPVIDDRRFEDLFEEVRQRIPRYSPEWRPAWNDLNDNDPGIAMVQVFTWLAETLIYRMNKIPALAYVKWRTGALFTEGQPGFTGELELLLAAVGVLFVGVGGGGWTVDRRFRRR